MRHFPTVILSIREQVTQRGDQSPGVPGGITSVVLGYSRIDGGAARVRVGKVSLCFDCMGDRPTLVRGDISIKRVHCVSYVLVSGVCVRRELVFPYVSIVIIN